MLNAVKKHIIAAYKNNTHYSPESTPLYRAKYQMVYIIHRKFCFTRIRGQHRNGDLDHIQLMLPHHLPHIILLHTDTVYSVYMYIVYVCIWHTVHTFFTFLLQGYTALTMNAIYSEIIQHVKCN